MRTPENSRAATSSVVSVEIFVKQSRHIITFKMLLFIYLYHKTSLLHSVKSGLQYASNKAVGTLNHIYMRGKIEGTRRGGRMGRHTGDHGLCPE